MPQVFPPAYLDWNLDNIFMNLIKLFNLHTELF